MGPQFELLAQAQHRQNAHIGRRLRIIEAPIVAAEPTEIARPHLTAIGIDVCGRSVGGGNGVSAVAHFARGFVEQFGAQIVAVGRQGKFARSRSFERIAAGNLGAIEHARFARGSADILKVIEVRFELIIGDRKIRDRHVFGNKFRAIALPQIAAQIEVFAQRSKVAAGPVRTRSAHARARFERAHLPIRHRGVLDAVARGNGFFRQALQELAVDGSFKLIDDPRIREVGLRIAIRTALERHHPQACVCEFLRHDGAGPAHAHDDRIDPRFDDGHQPRFPARSTGGRG